MSMLFLVIKMTVRMSVFHDVRVRTSTMRMCDHVRVGVGVSFFQRVNHNQRGTRGHYRQGDVKIPLRYLFENYQG